MMPAPARGATHVYRVAAGCEIRADVCRLDDDRPRPVIVWLHGGALVMGHRGQINPRQRDLYVGAGYVVVAADYRLAPQVKLPAIIHDLQAAFRWVRERGPGLFGADAGRVAAVGHSAGGYLALVSGFRVEPPPQALVSFYGYGDIAAPWYSEPDPFYRRQRLVGRDEAYRAVESGVLSATEGPHRRDRFYVYCRQQGLWPREVAGRDPQAEPRAFDPLCPERNVTSAYPPTLLLHGDADTDVPYEQSAAMARALEAAGVEHELCRFPGAGHGFDAGDTPHAAQAMSLALRFLAAHLGLPEAPANAE